MPSIGRGRRPGAASLGRDSGGFAILEVVIAFTILIMVLIPAADLYATVIGISANARDRVVATNLVAQQVDIGRASAFSGLAAQANTDSAQANTAKEGGITYTVTQTAQWVSESTNACGSTGNGAAGTQPILAVTETATWPDMGSTLPVVAQTDVAPPAGYYPATDGNLAVSVTDSNGNPVVGASVMVTSPATAGPVLTGPTGCAFMAFLSPGTGYDVQATLPGYVDMHENPTATADNLALGAGVTLAVPLNYAPAASVAIGLGSTVAVPPPTTTTVATTTTTVAATTTTTQVGTTTTTTTVPTTTTTVSTTTTTTPGSVVDPVNGYAVTALDKGSGTTITYPAPLTGDLELWPYADGYDIYPGGCPDNDPTWENGGSTQVYAATLPTPYAPFPVSQGVTTTDTLSLYGVSVTGVDGALPVTNMTVTVTDTTGGCASNNSFAFNQVPGNSINIGLPLGTWTISVSATVNGQLPPKTGSVSVTENGSALPAETVNVS
jgi:Tfp pilus assembly protein PilV